MEKDGPGQIEVLLLASSNIPPHSRAPVRHERGVLRERKWHGLDGLGAAFTFTGSVSLRLAAVLPQLVSCCFPRGETPVESRKGSPSEPDRGVLGGRHLHADWAREAWRFGCFISGGVISWGSVAGHITNLALIEPGFGDGGPCVCLLLFARAAQTGFANPR